MKDESTVVKKSSLPQKVQELTDKGIVVLELLGEDGQKYYFRKPGRQDLNRYLAGVQKQKLARATTDLVYDILVHPSREELERMFDDKPARMLALNNAIQTEIGLNEDFDVKKL